MALYSVHSEAEPLDTLQAADRVTFVKLGFSWVAFFWGWIWLLSQKLWAVFFLYWAVLVVMAALVTSLNLANWAILATWLALNVWLGVYGPGFVGRKLESRGLPETTFLEAPNLATAECRFFDSLKNSVLAGGVVR